MRMTQFDGSVDGSGDHDDENDEYSKEVRNNRESDQL